MSDLKKRIQEDTNNARRAQNKQRVNAMSLILAALKQREVDERITLDDSQILSILDKMIKQRRDSVAQYQKANRQDLIDQENYEIAVIQEYMPAALSEDEINQLVQQAISATAAKSMQDMGKVMAHLKPTLQGRADMGIVSNKIKQLLAGSA